MRRSDNMNFSLLTLVEITLLFTISVPSLAQFSRHMASSLKGVKSVGIEVAQMKQEPEQVGFGVAQIQTGVEQELRRNGIKITEDLAQSDGILFVAATCMPPSETKRRWFCTLKIDFIQTVILYRDPSITTTATTWTRFRLGRGDPVGLRQAIRDMTDEFCKDLLKQNPKA
jgi:hypothetical protein